MTESVAPPSRSPARKTPESDPAKPGITMPAGHFGEVGDLTVSISGVCEKWNVKKLNVRLIKNALERATRLCRKAIAAGINDVEQFSELLAALNEANRLERASIEAHTRVNQVLKERRADQQTSTTAPIPDAPTLLSLSETRS
ncbi:MAG TPA: hypothetical protein VG097_14225 [Gemmata sp.]|jgi:hypothetical protein|nr:hypothetical protein [Gemmata sp.]